MLDVQILHDRLDAYCRETLSDKEPRWHLGASEIGDDCMRRVWMKFRWIKQEQFDGRRLRLFKRGKDEEAKLAALLEAIGVTVVPFDESGKQHKFAAVMGHFGGARDGIGYCDLIPGVGFIVEYKTSGDKYFKPVVAKGVRSAKPEHYRQMCQYGGAAGVEWALYVVVNKNDDDIYFEFVRLDIGLALNDVRKADHIITSQIAPQRIAQEKTFYKCRMCFLVPQCFEGAAPDKNCRSCTSAHAMPGGEWYCAAYQRPIPRDFVPHGCPNWRSIL